MDELRELVNEAEKAPHLIQSLRDAAAAIDDWTTDQQRSQPERRRALDLLVEMLDDRIEDMQNGGVLCADCAVVLTDEKFEVPTRCVCWNCAEDRWTQVEESKLR